jgi:hypothetical protein
MNAPNRDLRTPLKPPLDVEESEVHVAGEAESCSRLRWAIFALLGAAWVNAIIALLW